MVDFVTCRTITSLVEKLSTSGHKTVDTCTKPLFKELVKSAGLSEEHLKFCWNKLLQQLEAKHSEIRLGAFIVVDSLFRKSECFRELLLNDCHKFLELTVESNPKKLLPPPIESAKELKQKALQTIQKWQQKYGTKHHRISLAYNFLKHSLKIDFDDALKRNATELEKVRKVREKSMKLNEMKVNVVKTEMDDNVEEISRLVTEMSNGYSILIPLPVDFFNEEDDYANEDDSSMLREHGFLGPKSSISVDISKTQEKMKRTEDNNALVDSLNDVYFQLTHRFMPLVKRWISTTSKAENEQLFKKAMDLKDLMHCEIEKFEKLGLVSTTISTKKLHSEEESDDNDDDFEDVPEKEGYELEAIAPPVFHKVVSETQPSNTVLLNSMSNVDKITQAAASETKGWKVFNENENSADDPASILATLRKLKEHRLRKEAEENGILDSLEMQKPEVGFKSLEAAKKAAVIEASTGSAAENPVCNVHERKQKLLEKAPKLPFDIDLYHWEDEKLTAPSVELSDSVGHRFWNSCDREGEVVESPEGTAALRTRVMEFSGTFEPVKWSCRAPLSSGKLCPRKDRFKCPFHGTVIARDEYGNPTRPEDIAELIAQKEREDREKPPDWQDPAFLRDIKAEIGIDLTIAPPKRGKKSFAEMYPHLTDLNKNKNTPRNRLKKIVFNKGATKRVAATLDEISHKQFRDKFGDQWNYSMNE